MLNRITIAALMTVLFGLLAGHATAAPPTDFWQNKYFMNMAHAGGAKEAPANTLFAFKKAVENGADSLEMDGYVTADGVFVVTHDSSPNATSDIANTPYAGMTVDQMTLAQLKTLDFAYKFSPGKGHFNYDPGDPHPYRGMALEDGPEPPAGYNRNDFRIATFKEVLDAFPNTPINIDMKAPSNNQQMATAAADVLAALMQDYEPERSEDVIVASFWQGAMERFHQLLPEHKALTASQDELLDYALHDDPITPTPVALQPPDTYPLNGVSLDTVKVLKAKAVADGYAIHVWPQNGSVDGPELWQKMIDQGANGFFTDFPSQMQQFLCDKGIPRPDGSLRCPEQQCPDGYTGYAPNCEQIPVCPDGEEGTPPACHKVCPTGSVLDGDTCKCPPGQVGTPPNCEPHGDPKTVVTRVYLGPKKVKIKAGKTTKLKVKIKAKLGLAPHKFRIKLKSSNKQVKLPKSVVINLDTEGANGTVNGSKMIKVRAARKAKGKATVTASYGKLKAKSVLTVKKLKKKKHRR